MLYGIRERKGFVQLTGEVGAGKTTLCRALLEQLGENFSTALILNPVLDADQLVKAIAMEFELEVRGMDRLEMIAVINDFLLRQMAANRESVLIIDEAQDLTNELLEQVRLLSNLETDERKLLQIILMGQPELRDRLNDQPAAPVTPAHHRPISLESSSARRGGTICASSFAGIRRQRRALFYAARLVGAFIITAREYPGW